MEKIKETVKLKLKQAKRWYFEQWTINRKVMIIFHLFFFFVLLGELL